MKLRLVTPIENREHSTVTDAQMVNCYAEVVRQDKILAVKRSGLSFSFQGVNGTGQGIYNFLENLYSVSGDTLNINKTFTPGFNVASSGAGPTPRAGIIAIGFQGKLWQMGGEYVDPYGVVTRYGDAFSSLDGVAWTQAPTPGWSARSWAQAIVFQNKLFVMGGVDQAGNALSDVWVTSDGQNWTEVNAKAWPGRCQFGVCEMNGRLWVAGGRAIISDASGLDAGYKNDVWYSTDGTGWVQATGSAQWLPRARFGFASLSGKLIVLAGEVAGYWRGSVGDLWTSSDGVTWTRISSNPFSQGATSVFSRIVLTTIGANYEIAPTPLVFSGGGGTGAAGFVSILDEDEMDADTGGLACAVTLSNGGSGYTSAPSVSFPSGGGNQLQGYCLLTSAGAAGDKRGCIVASNSGILYFFGFLNNGSPSGDLWSSTDGVTWTLVSTSEAYGVRDSVAIAYGNLWVFGGVNAGTYYNDVWSGQLQPTNQLALSITAQGNMFDFSQTSSTITSPLLFFKSNTDAFSYNPATNLVTTVSGHGSYPAATVPGIVYLDASFYVMDPQGRVFGSGINDPTSWTSLNEITEQNEPNGGVAIAKFRSSVVAFGVWSTTFFYDAAVAAPASPLLPDNTLASIIGCASGDSVVEMRGTVVWIGQSRREGRAVYVLSDFAPTPISTPFVNRILQSDDLSEVRAFAAEMNGHSIYVLTLVRSNITLVYDFNSQLWSRWTSCQPGPSFGINSLVCDSYGRVTANAPGHAISDGDPVTVNGSTNGAYNGTYNMTVVDNNTLQYRLATVPNTPGGGAIGMGSIEGYFYCVDGAELKGVTYLQHESNGIIFQLLPDSFADYGNPIDVRVRTDIVGDEQPNELKLLGWVNLTGDNVAADALLRYTDDDYQTYSTFRRIDLSSKRKRLNNLGSFFRRAFEVRHTASTRFRVEAIDLPISLGH